MSIKASFRLAAGLALLAGPALTQAGPIHAPCLAVHPQPTDYVAAMEVEGWTLAAEDPGRAKALGGPTLAYALSAMLPPRPATSEELGALLSEATNPRQARRFEGALAFTRGDAAAAITFDALGDGLVLDCWFAAPRLPELDGLALESPQFGSEPFAVAFAMLEAPVPEGATGVTVSAVRLVPGVTPAAPPPGAEAISVALERVEPRIVVPHRGLMQAFAPHEMTEALRLVEDGSP